MTFIFVIIHLIALFTFPIALIITIPFHILAVRGENTSNILKEARIKSEVAQRERAYEKELEEKEKEYERLNSMNSKNDEDSKKWETAKKYTNEVQSGLSFIYSKIKPSNYNKAENALKEVLLDLGVSAINQGVLNNIVDQINGEEKMNMGATAEDAGIEGVDNSKLEQ